MKQQQWTDKALVIRVQQGDKQAFNLLVGKYQHKVAGLIAKYVNNPGDVADITQEAFIKAYRALPNFRGDSAFYTWLYRIAVNTAKNHIVAQGRRPPANDVDAQEAEFYDGGEVMHESSTPEALLLTDEIRNMVFATIDELPEELRMAITLREIEGLSYDEIADVMACPVGTVRSRIFRAREAIDKRIQPLLERS
ncbi:MAG: ECF RNA polymerase sigma-E factor [Candidatus Celerinatantimonas neptuna]|nr:MAG: ECF RNA polymerase sigma-E factor [Candidatus Celerinatantimonas neptuna]